VQNLDLANLNLEQKDIEIDELKTQIHNQTSETSAQLDHENGENPDFCN
jgi:hypothetical protein